MVATTIKDIARKLGVAPSTVSMALRGHPRISKKTRLKVLETAKRLNYKVNILARGLVLRKSSLLGLVIPDIMTSFFPEIIQGVEEAADKLGYSIIIRASNNDFQKEADSLRFLRDRHVEGVIVAPVSTKNNIPLILELEKSGIPIVFICNYLKGVNIPYIVVDDVLGAYLATQHLIDLGHRRIAHLRGVPEYPVSQNRIKGYKKALKEHNFKMDKVLIRGSDFTFESGYQAMKEFIALENRPTAVFAACDMAVIGAMRTIRETGLRVPEDIALVGFDDLKIAALMETRITTIAQPKYEIGEKAIQKLTRRIEKKLVRSSILKPKLVIRDSCGAESLSNIEVKNNSRSGKERKRATNKLQVRVSSFNPC